jgi:hypothetical protein
LFDRVKGAAALAAGAGAANADGGNALGDQNKNKMAKKKIKKIRNDRQHRQQDQDVLSTVAIGQVAPNRGEERARGIARGKNQPHGHCRKTELGEIDGENHTEIGKGKCAHPSRRHQHEHVSLKVFADQFHRAKAAW